MNGSVPPRIYCIPATKAPLVAVIARGPTNWCHVGRWDLGQRRYEPGAWLGGRIFPRRSDLSPDGRFLCYFAHKPSASWEHGEAYVALSKLPWLTALHAFSTCGTWTRGYYFTENKDCENPDDMKLPIPYGLRSIAVVQLPTNGGAAGKKRRTLPNAIPRTRGISVATPACRNASPGVIASSLCGASAGLAANSASIRRSTACGSTIG
jgi:hypothetical protein